MCFLRNRFKLKYHCLILNIIFGDLLCKKKHVDEDILDYAIGVQTTADQRFLQRPLLQRPKNDQIFSFCWIWNAELSHRYLPVVFFFWVTARFFFCFIFLLFCRTISPVFTCGIYLLSDGKIFLLFYFSFVSRTISPVFTCCKRVFK